MSKITKPQPVSNPDIKAIRKERVDLLGVVEFLYKHVTEALCENVFKENRTAERQREWTLYALVQFWLAINIRAPKALRQALAQCQQGQDKLWPHVETTPDAFFKKSKAFSWTFFSQLYKELDGRFMKEARQAYASDMQDLLEHFPQVWAMDGSQLSEVAHKLKILWDVQGAVLPGRLFAFYDLFLGINRGLQFEPDAARNENLLATESLESVPKGTLVVGDRLFGVPKHFRALAQHQLWGLFRKHGRVKVKIVRVLSCHQAGGRESLEDLLVEVKSKESENGKLILRLIRCRQGKGRKLDLFTNVLETKKLPAQRAVKLYGRRWGIERMFFDLKEVLNLNRFYAANPNAIAAQVYAAAIVYNAFRIMQARIANKHGIAPEMLSPAKLYPKLALACSSFVNCEWMWHKTLKLNPGVSLRKPNYREANFASTSLESILVAKKKKPRTKGKPNPPHLWLSWKKIPGGEQLLKN